MGRNRRNLGQLHHSPLKTDVNGDQHKEPRYFRDLSIDIDSLRVQWGLLSIATIRELDLSDEELSAMLMSQLDLRDTFIQTLTGRIYEMITKGCVLEEERDYLDREMWNLRQGCGELMKIKTEPSFDNNDKVDGDVESKLDELIKLARNKKSNSLPPESERLSNSPHSLPSSPAPSGVKVEPLDVREKETPVEDTSDKKTDNSEKDKFKAMVAMAFKAQGYGFLAGVKSEKDSEGVKSEKDSEGVKSEKDSEGVEDDNDTNSDLEPGEIKDDESSTGEDDHNPGVGHGWNLEGTQSITEQVKAAAADAVAVSGYTYQEDLGLYYDYTSGYYYNAENGLYYDSKSGTYFFFDHATNSYQFHSQVSLDANSSSSTRTTANSSSSTRTTANSSSSTRTTASSSSSTRTTEQKEKGAEEIKSSEEDRGVANSHEAATENTANIPPSLRLMVIESGVDTVKIGALHLVTINGGKIGRKPENLIQLLDVSVSKVHAEFLYRSKSADDHHYYVKDLGSNLGTFINGTCICIPGEPSDEIEIGHGWELQFGSVKMKCHIHPGYLSCNDCEPGLVLANFPSQSGDSSSSKHKPTSIEKARLKILKAMKKKYAINDFCESNIIPSLPPEYEDRAKKRRIEKGSDNPYEKTEVASTETELRDDNKGFEMLQKMGWAKGQGLGKSEAGIVKPIEATSTMGRGGLGYGQGMPPPSGNYLQRKKVLDVTKQRYKKL